MALTYPTFVYDTYASTWIPEEWDSSNTYLTNFGADPEIIMQVPEGWSADGMYLYVPPGLYAFSWYFYAYGMIHDMAYSVLAHPTEAALVEGHSASSADMYFSGFAYNWAGSYNDFTVSGYANLATVPEENSFFQFSAAKVSGDTLTADVYQTILVSRLDV